ncbi:hypothetical protein TNCV_4110981 [Trichonephila clavipes]|nr:hypothetical protein TNCV_4110981 [Trichonephila clavipes]
MGAEFLFMDDNARPNLENIVDEYLQSEDITPTRGLLATDLVIFGKLEERRSSTSIAKEFGINKSVVSRSWKAF